MKLISSRENPLFKRLRDAIREHKDEIVIEGPKAVADALAAGWKPIAVVRRDIDFEAKLFDALAETKSPQNVIGLFPRREASLAKMVDKGDAIIVALDGVQDPGNVGTIVRLAAAFDCGGVALLPGCADVFSPKAIRASAGAVLTVAVAKTTAREVIASGLPLYFADALGRSAEVPPSRAILVFGNEGAGVSEEIRRAAKSIRIPMSPRVESLNVAASAAILLSKSYESR